MKYKGYTAKIEYDDYDDIFHGYILNIRAIISFEGESIQAMHHAFEEAVDDYLEWCKEEGWSPEKSCSGKFNLRIDPELHRQLILAAESRGESLNSYVVDCLEHAID